MNDIISKTKNLELSRAITQYVEFINPPNTVKAKVGTGGLSDAMLEKAQRMMESYVKDYPPVATLDLLKLQEALNMVIGDSIPKDEARRRLNKATMDLKSNGAMFNYPLVSRMASGLLEFIDPLSEFDQDSIEIIRGHYDALKAVIDNRQAGTIDKHGEALVLALRLAVERYFKKNNIG